ncbi:Hypothetical protein PHPALM_11685 [Phytophthora palmivora]|uniref:Uncharacterized protein n=1 Tax=Phytophthora palmivora TaxID=4796 RepID=A0A2P4Y1N5_9STRA|nr:Hypothetical protein PHPALM_11685 [Phytophthora palmivora]
MSKETKKRKATYLKQKEEQDSLQDQINILERLLDEFKAKKSGTTQLEELCAAVGLNNAMKNAVQQHHLGVATAQSLISQWLQNHSGNPMDVFIHLGQEWPERRATLLQMKDGRLERGFRFVTARCQHLDALKPHLSEERFEDANGDFCCVRNEVIPFPGVQSMRKVFDAVKFTLNTLEISISEQLGHITVRDDYDVVETDSFICNYRLTSGIDSGVTTELNAVAFGQFVENPSVNCKEPYAVVAIDSVDQDDLHPYHPHKCVRKVINGTVVLIPVPCRSSKRFRDFTKIDPDVQTEESKDSGEVEIVMLRYFFAKTCHPEFEVSEFVTQELRDNITRWGDVVLQAKRKATYLRRQEERNILQIQVRKLQRELENLQAKSSDEAIWKKKLYEVAGHNVAMENAVKEQQLGVAMTQSMISEWHRNHSSRPMSMPIHLGRSWAARRDTLLKMKDQRLTQALHYVTTRCQHLEPLKYHISEERFEDDNGDFCCLRDEVIPFPGVQSLHDVFEASKFTMDTLEICISEQLGHLTIRDDYDTVDSTTFISNYRLVSAMESGIMTEFNVVAFGQQIEGTDGQPCAVFSIDSVNQDDLHPYHPNKCVRKVIDGSIVLIQVPRHNVKCEGTRESCENEMVIVMMRSIFAKTCRPQFDVSEITLQELQDNVTRWGDVVIQAIRRILYANVIQVGNETNETNEIND